MVNSLRKGKGFERKIARMLSKELKAEFKRVPMSGAFSTRENTKNNVFKGDIFTEDKRWRGIVIECKKTGKKLLIDYLLREDSIIWEWVRQAEFEADGNEWWLIFQEDYGEPKILTRNDIHGLERLKIYRDGKEYYVYLLKEYLGYEKWGR